MTSSVAKRPTFFAMEIVHDKIWKLVIIFASFWSEQTNVIRTHDLGYNLLTIELTDYNHSIITPPRRHTTTSSQHKHSITIEDQHSTITKQPQRHTCSSSQRRHTTSTASHLHTVTKQPQRHTCSSSQWRHTTSTASHLHTVTKQPQRHTCSIIIITPHLHNTTP